MLKLNFAQFPVLETERLLLREHTLQDAEALFALRTNPEVMQYIDRERPNDIFDIKQFITRFNEGFRESENLAWVMSLKEEPQKMIGSIGFWRLDLANYRAEVGYQLHPDYWRKGYISEALKATIQFGFESMKLHSIQANINPNNDASRHVLLKHHFIKEAYLKESYYFNGQFLDTEIYGLLNPNN
ncbi:GNAT family N-acetyltransferase [Pedobacter sp. MW01-1-1]|uniref:GNAT family N-acetyltransferase n=1 Tax=Pedobacter sp. MW01-1-1 TaxID=3383027 RepID=UPI003FEF4FCE